jgi:hypothetical protein
MSAGWIGVGLGDTQYDLFWALHAPKMASSIHSLGWSILKIALTFFTSLISLWLLSIFFAKMCKLLKVTDFNTYSTIPTQSRENIHQMVVDYKMIKSRACCYLHFLPFTHKRLHGTLKTAHGYQLFLSQRRKQKVRSVCLRPQN